MVNGPGSSSQSSDNKAADGSSLRINNYGNRSNSHSGLPIAPNTGVPRLHAALDPAPRHRKFSASSSRFLVALAFALALAAAPTPVFAQHGGGGGHGGGFGGAGHSGGGHAGPSGGSHSGAAHGGAPVSGTYGLGSAGNSAAHSATSSRFIGASTWQAPPSAAMRGGVQPSMHFISSDEAAASGTRVVGTPVEPRGIGNPLGASTALRASPTTAGTFGSTRSLHGPFRSFVPGPPHVPGVPFRNRPVFIGPGFGFGFFGFGCFGPFIFGCGGFFGPGYWGCPGYSYYNGGPYGNTIYNESTDESSVSNEFNPNRYSFPSAPPETNGGSSAGAANEPDVVLFLKDGTVYDVTEYWVADGKLHYVTNYGGENAIPLEQIDMQRTVDVNAKRGVNIMLRPSPPSQSQPAPDDLPLPNDAPPAPNL